MLSVKQGGIKYHFFESLVWLDPVSRVIDEHFNQKANEAYLL